MAEADKQREAGLESFQGSQKDLEDTITALDEALKSLEGAKSETGSLLSAKAKHAVQKALAFVDVYAPAAASEKVHAFLQRKEEPMTADKSVERGVRVREYDFKSGGVIEILKQLKLSFEDQLEELRKGETNAANAHKLSNAAQEDEVNAATTAKQKKEDLKAAKGEAKAGAEADLNDATEARNSAQTVLDDTKKTCTTRADEFEDRTKRRAGEVEAMKQAVEILEKITGTRTPEEKGISFLQLGKATDPRSQVVNLIRKAANAHILMAGKDGKALQKLAEAIARTQAQPLGSGTFDQIVNMIQKMIFQLKAEQTNEDNHKNWCDKEIAKTIKDNNEQVAKLQFDIEQMTELRNEQKAENAATVKDAEEAQTAIASAIAVLTDFYKSTGAIEKES